MVISSRTPEGDPNRCPICRHSVVLEPSIDTRDAPCPHCGHLLWFDNPSAVDRSAKAAGVTLADAVLEIGTKRLGVPSESDRVAVIEALEKLGASTEVRMATRGEWETALRYLGKIAKVDVLEKARTAKTWRDLVSELTQRK